MSVRRIRRKENYRFLGWSTSSAFEKAWTFLTDKVVKVTTLFAKWAKGDYKVSFSSGKLQDIYVMRGAIIQLPVIEEEGFLGWLIDGKIWEGGSNYLVKKDVQAKACFGETAKVGEKDMEVVNVTEATKISVTGVPEDSYGSRALQDLMENEAVISYQTEISNHVKSSALRNYLMDPDAEQLVFFMSSELVKMEGYEDTTANSLKLTYEMAPMCYTLGQNGNSELQKIANEDLTGEVGFALAVPNNVTQNYAKIEHLDDAGSFSPFVVSVVREKPADVPVIPAKETEDSENSSWWMSTDSGWVIRPGTNDWYYVKNNTLLRGWFLDAEDGRGYYLDPSTGKMLTGWTEVNGKWYYLSPAIEAETWTKGTDGKYHYDPNTKARPYGSMYCNEVTPDGYKTDAGGAWDGSAKVR